MPGLKNSSAADARRGTENLLLRKAGYRSPGNQYIPDQTSGNDRQVGCPERCGYADPAIWFGTQSELTFSHALPKWRL